MALILTPNQPYLRY